MSQPRPDPALQPRPATTTQQPNDAVTPTLGGETLEPRILMSVTWILGGLSPDNLLGTLGADRLLGTDGADTIDGGDGDDVLIGGLGDDALLGGGGIDIVDYSGAAGQIVVDLANGLVTGAAGHDTLTDVEGAVGSAYDDTFVMSAGDDVVDGGSGHDTVDFSGAGGPITVDLSAKGPQATGAGDDTLIDVEGVIGSSFYDRFQFANAQGGDRYTVDGGAGGGVLDLSNFKSDAVTMASDALIVDLGGGQQFRIDYTNIDKLSFGDTDVAVADLVAEVKVPTDAGTPDADAGLDQTVAEGAVVTLDASGSSDPDGDPLTWKWVQTGGPAVTLDDANAAQPTFTAPTLGSNTTVTFEVTVSDGTNTSTDTVTVSIGDWIEGSDDVDIVKGGDADDAVRTFGGDDVVSGGLGDDRLDGGEGFDTVDYSGANGAVTVDLTVTSAQDTGADGVDTLQGFEGVVGSAFDDVFAFTAPVDGAVYTVDGGGGSDNTIDLSRFASSAITFGDGVVSVDLGGGQAFKVVYTNVQNLQFGDVSARVITADTNAGSFTGDRIFVDGGEAFRIDVQGGGSIDWSYKVGTDTLTITDTTGTGPATTIDVSDLSGAGLNIDSIHLDDNVGTLTSDVDIGTLQLLGSGSLQTLDLAGGRGTLGTLTTDSGDLDAALTVDGNVTSIALSGDVKAELHVTGDVGSLTLHDSKVAIRIDGDTTLIDAHRFEGATTLGGDVGTITLTDNVKAPLQIAGNLGSLTLHDSSAEIRIGGDVGALTAHNLDGPTYVGGDLQKLVVSKVQTDLVVAGDLDAAAVGSVDKVTITAQRVVGTLDFTVGGVAFGGSYARPHTFVFDGATDQATATACANVLPIADAGADQTVREGAVVQLSAAGTSDADGDALTYRWVQVSGPQVELDDPASARPSFTVPAARSDATIVFELEVYDGTGVTRDTISVDVRAVDDAPTVQVSGTSVVASGGIVSLTAEARDSDSPSLTYRWTQIAGPTVAIADPSAANISFQAPEAREGADLAFEVAVSDGTTITTRIMTVSVAPMASTGNTSTPTPTTTTTTTQSSSTSATATTKAPTASSNDAQTNRDPVTTVRPTVDVLRNSTTATSSDSGEGASGGDPTSTTTSTASTPYPVTDLTSAWPAWSSDTDSSAETTTFAASLMADSDATAAPEAEMDTSTSTSDNTRLDSVRADDRTRLDENLLRSVLADVDVEAATGGTGASVLLPPDLVVGDGGGSIDLLPRAATGAGVNTVEDVRWTQTAGTPVAVDGNTGATLRVQLPEVFVEEELVFEVELWRNGERTVQEITVQVQPVGMIGRSLSIDEHVAGQEDADTGADDAPTGGVGKLWGALLAFLGAQPRRRDET